MATPTELTRACTSAAQRIRASFAGAADWTDLDRDLAAIMIRQDLSCLVPFDDDPNDDPNDDTRKEILTLKDLPENAEAVQP